MNEDVKIHPDPIWGEKANFGLQIRIETGDARLDAEPRYEQLFVKQRADDLYEVCCIPFFLYDVSLGDVLKVTTHDGAPVVEGVVEPSGHHTFRVWFGRVFMPVARDTVIDELSTLPGVLMEWFSPNLLGLDAENDDVARMLARFLETAMSRGQLQYETGRTR
jgi:hypothetical protein